MTLYETPQMHVIHVYGQIDRRGAVLCFRHLEVSLEELFRAALGTSPNTAYHATVQFSGSKYDVYYVRTEQVEAYTVRQHSDISRPLGLEADGPRVTQLHFYRPHGKSWQMLDPELNVRLETPELVLA